MAKFGMRNRPRIRREPVRYDEPDVLELLMKHINGEINDPNILGLSYEFYGANICCFKLGYNGRTIVLEAIENEDDGYRSSFECLGRREEGNMIFFRQPVAVVSVQADSVGEFDGWCLASVHNDHKWLRFGTDNYDDYYPSFSFEYNPDKQETIDLDSKESYINHVVRLLESVKDAVDSGISELNVLKQRYSRASAEGIIKMFKENGLGDFAIEVEEIIEIAENE